MRKSVILITVVAASRLARVVLGFGGGTGILDVAFSAPDAPNIPSKWPSLGGSGGAGSGPPSDRSPDGDSGDPRNSGDGGPGDGDPGDGDPGDGDPGDGDPGDDGPPEGHESWTDFFDWATWTTAKNALPRGMGLPIDVLELGVPLGETLGEVKKNHQRKRELLNTDFKGDSHLRSGGDE